jgi:carbamoylphosphate synthase large subunit
MMSTLLTTTATKTWSAVASQLYLSQSKEEENPVAEYSTTSSLRPLAQNLQKRHKIDASLLSSGLDDSPDALSGLDNLVPILGNPTKVFLKVRDKPNFFVELKRLGVSHPKTVIAHNSGEAKSISKDLGLPLLLKPAAGFGGVGIRLDS